MDAITHNALGSNVCHKVVIVVVIGRNWTLPLGLFRTNFTIFIIG